MVNWWFKVDLYDRRYKCDRYKWSYTYNPYINGLRNRMTLQGINISHLGKRKIIFKMPFWGDMLVPWRVTRVKTLILWPVIPRLPILTESWKMTTIRDNKFFTGNFSENLGNQFPYMWQCWSTPSINGDNLIPPLTTGFFMKWVYKTLRNIGLMSLSQNHRDVAMWVDPPQHIWPNYNIGES